MLPLKVKIKVKIDQLLSITYFDFLFDLIRTLSRLSPWSSWEIVYYTLDEGFQKINKNFSLFLYFFYKKVNYPSNLNLIECLNTQRFSRVYICRLHKGLSTTSSWISRRLPNEIQDPISRHYISNRRESGSLASL